MPDGMMGRVRRSQTQRGSVSVFTAIKVNSRDQSYAVDAALRSRETQG
jgi:hypothetical protein